MDLPAVGSKMQTGISLIVLLVLSFCTYYLHFADPNLIFWDENFFIPSASRYLVNIAQFEAHPPLGKLLIAAGEYWIGGNNPQDWQVLAQYKHITGEQLPKTFVFSGMRMLPTLFGMFSALLVYGLMLSLTGKKPVMALLFTALYVFENAYIVHFRAAHLDSFQFFFSVAAFWLFADAWQSAKPLSWRTYAALAGFIALAMMVKVNAVLLVLLLPVLYWRELASTRPTVGYAFMPLRVARTLSNNAMASQNQKRYAVRTLLGDFVKKSLAALVAGIIVCVTVFAVHVSLGRKLPDINTSTGWADLAYFSPAYRQFIEQQGSLTPAVLLAAGQDYFAFMQNSHLSSPKLESCKAGENGSSPLSWPLMTKTFNYRWDSKNGQTRYLQLAGNPFSWGLAFVALLASFSLVISHRLLAVPVRDQALYRQIEVYCGFYLLYMGLHVYFSSKRVMYLYHYFLGLLISFILVALLWQYLERAHPNLRRYRYGFLSLMLVGIVAGYLFISPLTYHQPLDKPSCELRNLLKPIVECQ